MDRKLPRSLIAWALVGSLVAYAAIAALHHWWVSMMAATVVAALLGWSHRRARFAAYVFWTVLAFRGVVVGAWALPVYSVVALAAMQTEAARRAWPRLVPGRLPGGDDRMRRS